MQKTIFSTYKMPHIYDTFCIFFTKFFIPTLHRYCLHRYRFQAHHTIYSKVESGIIDFLISPAALHRKARTKYFWTNRELQILSHAR